MYRKTDRERRAQDKCPSALLLLLESFFARLAHFDSLSPFRVEHLVRTDATAGVGVQDRIDHITTPRLEINVSIVFEATQN